jgi:uncharacterized protein DUF222/HNH endonuclease
MSSNDPLESWLGQPAADLSAMSDGVLLDHIRRLSTVADAVSAELTRAIAVAHRRGAVGYDGAVSTHAWLRQRLRRGDAAAHLRAAGVLENVPEVAAAYARGEIGLAHVDVVAAVLPDITPEVLAAGAGKLLAEQAVAGPPRLLARAAVRIRDHFAPAAAEGRVRRQLDQRWLSVARTFEGAVALQGVLDPEGGELVLATLAALMPPPALTDTRPAATRRADALLDLCRLAADAVPTAGGHKPQVAVTIDWETLSGGRTPVTTPSTPLTTTSTPLTTSSGRWRGATLGSGCPIGVDTARRLACDAAILPAVLGSAGEVLDLGRTARVVNPGLRRALTVRDRGCRFPACDRPPEWTDAHHVVSWAAGGTTNLDNLVLLCRHHHTLVHEGGWSIHIDPHTGTVTATSREGRPLGVRSGPRGQSP